MSDTRIIKINRKLLEDPEIAEIFKTKHGEQIYLAVGSCHLRSQHFNKAILCVSRQLSKRRSLPKSADALRDLFARYGYADPAARFPWKVEFESVGDVEDKDEWYRNRALASKANNDRKRLERDAHFQALLDAFNGINPWISDWQ